MAECSYLLDTNIISALARDPQGLAYHALKSRVPAYVCTSIIVASEIEYGLQKTVSQRLRKQVEAILSSLDVLPFQSPAEHHHGEIRTYLQQIGQPIGYNDLFIAAHARSLGFVLVSANVGEFARVPNLLLENWLLPYQCPNIRKLIKGSGPLLLSHVGRNKPIGVSGA